MNLTFNKINNAFVSEFSVTSDFNLHVERSKGGSFTIFQRSSDGGNYGEVYYQEKLDKIKAIDYDFSALIYPKYIKIVSEVEPTYAAITTDGEVTEIKTQNKEIDITSNGTISVIPDAGFSYLSKVDVKVDVPISGGSDESIEYINTLGEFNFLQALSGGIISLKIYIDSEEEPIDFIITDFLSAFPIMDFDGAIILAASFNKNQINKTVIGDTVTTKTAIESIEENKGKLEIYNMLPRITKEQFYSIPQDVVIENTDEKAAKELFESLWTLIRIAGASEDETDLGIPIIFAGYKSINGDNTHIDRYNLNQTLYTNDLLNTSIKGEGVIDMIYLSDSNGLNWTDGVGKITLNDGTIRYSLFNLPT